MQKNELALSMDMFAGDKNKEFKLSYYDQMQSLLKAHDDFEAIMGGLYYEKLA